MNSVGMSEMMGIMLGIFTLLFPVAFIACLTIACIRRTAVWWILTGVSALVAVVIMLVVVLFIGARAWKKGSDRAAAEMERRELARVTELETRMAKQDITCKKGLVRLTVPQDWSDLTEQIANPEATLSYGNLADEQYVIVITETRADIVNAFGEEDPFGKMHALLVPNLAKSLEDPVTQAVQSFDHPGAIHAVRTRIEGGNGGLNLTYAYYMFETRDHFHQLIFWTISDDLDNVLPRFEEAASTFAVVE